MSDVATYMQLTLTGRERRDQGVRNVELAQHREDRKLVDRILLLFADGGMHFTSDDVTPYLPLGFRPNALGAAFLRFSKRGIIECVGYTQSERPEAHARVIKIWKGAY